MCVTLGPVQDRLRHSLLLEQPMAQRPVWLFSPGCLLRDTQHSPGAGTSTSTSDCTPHIQTTADRLPIGPQPPPTTGGSVARCYRTPPNRVEAGGGGACYALWGEVQSLQ